MFQIMINDSLAQARSIAYVGHLGPVVVRNGIERTNCLPSWIVFDKSYLTGYIYLRLLFRDIMFLRRLRLGTEATTVMDHIFRESEECRVPMQVYLSIFWFVPFCIQKKVLRVKQLLDLFGMIFLSVRNGECIWQSY